MVVQDLRLNHRAEVQPGILAEECGALLESFFRTRRRGQV
jgi:tRNA(adenine34) deaminase